MVDIRFDTYYDYAGLTAILEQYAAEYPDLITLGSIGKSYEGRDIWLMTVTNQATGADTDKPAIYVHGNIHSVEVATSSACLHLLHTLTAGYGTDERITYLLDSRVYYVVPRVNPDGVEWVFADKPKYRRSSIRPFPYDEDPISGLVQQDIDGNGRMLQMRIIDPNGHWKAHPDEPRLMIRRDPDEYGGTYYRIFNEGLIDNYDGFTVKTQTPKEGLDLNRNYPNHWRPHSEQLGAGDFPTSEPEVHAVTQFIAQHNNICGAIDIHTMSGVLLRPFSGKPDSEMQAEDLWVYEKQGAKGKELIGYPDMSIYHGFKYHPNQVLSGGGDWMYEHLGMYYWAIEIWNPRQHAGIEVEKFIEWWREHTVEDGLKLLQWSDEALNGKGFVDWYTFEHPQLGTVELGGWELLYTWINPPHHLLEDEIKNFAQWFIWQGLTTPKLELVALEVQSLGGDAHRIQMVVQNTGWLPTHCTVVALQKKRVRGVIAEIDLPDGATLQNGLARREYQQLTGRNHTPMTNTGRSITTTNTDDRLLIEWIVTVPAGSEVTVTARHDRAGVVRETITL